MTLVGGIGTILGPVVGATVIIGMQNYLATLGEWVLVIQGAIFVACVMLFRRGMVGEIIEYMRVRSAEKESTSASQGGHGGGGAAPAAPAKKPAALAH